MNEVIVYVLRKNYTQDILRDLNSVFSMLPCVCIGDGEGGGRYFLICAQSISESI